MCAIALQIQKFIQEIFWAKHFSNACLVEWWKGQKHICYLHYNAHTKMAVLWINLYMHIHRSRNYADNNWNYDKLISCTCVTWTTKCLPNSHYVLVHGFFASLNISSDYKEEEKKNLSRKLQFSTNTWKKTKKKRKQTLWIERSFAFIRCEFLFLIIFVRNFVRIFVRALMCSKNHKKKKTVYMCDIFQMINVSISSLNAVLVLFFFFFFYAIFVETRKKKLK